MSGLFSIISLSLILKLGNACHENMPILLTNIEVAFLKKTLAG